MSTSPYAVFRRLTEAGAADETADAVPRSDAGLWALATEVSPQQYPDGPLDPVEVHDLRAAYDDGRRPDRIDLYRLAALIRERGVNAFVGRAGGGNAVIQVGDTYTMLTGEQQHVLLAGPAVFHGSDAAFGERDDFSIGPPDDDLAHRKDDPMIRLDPEPFRTHADLAEATVALAHAEADRHTRIAAWLDMIVQTGWAAFWDAVNQAALHDFHPDHLRPDETTEREITRQRLTRHVRRLLHDRLAHIDLLAPDIAECGVCFAGQGEPCTKSDCWGRIDYDLAC